MKSGIVENNQKRFFSVVGRCKTCWSQWKSFQWFKLSLLSPTEPWVCCWAASLYHVKEEVNIPESEQEAKTFINQVLLSVMSQSQILGIFSSLKTSWRTHWAFPNHANAFLCDPMGSRSVHWMLGVQSQLGSYINANLIIKRISRP